MRFGVQMIFQAYGYPGECSDAHVIADEVRLGELADRLGFDCLWPVEHHFADYAFCPDNVVFLAHMAARTSRIGLGTGAVILPWNQPIRVAERMSLLDHLAPARVRFGIGRGLARREYEGFGIAMDESRARFDEAAPMILDALETGFIEGAGPFYPQARTAIRPRPRASFADRVYSVGMSPDSVDAAADLGAHLVVFSQKSWDEQAEIYRGYQQRFRARHRREAPPLLTCDFVYCDRDRSRAEDRARKHIAGYLTSVMGHYELMSDHFKQAAGYEAYGNAVDLLRAIGLQKVCDLYLEVQAWGTPDDIIDRLRARTALIGDFDLNCCFRFAGLPIQEAEHSMRTFAQHVVPVMAPSDASTTSRSPAPNCT
jgi:alkanesulfonate monooxygenase SsuD/methylene tetrahydromethanopterin reductase-like flavin-dependent oxidoreductase (luciferase family)